MKAITKLIAEKAVKELLSKPGRRLMIDRDTFTSDAATAIAAICEDDEKKEIGIFELDDMSGEYERRGFITITDTRAVIGDMSTWAEQQIPMTMAMTMDMIMEMSMNQAATIDNAITLLDDAGARVAAIRLFREMAKVVKVEAGSYDPSEDWLMWDGSVLHIGNPNASCFTPYAREVELDTIGGKILRDELMELYQYQQAGEGI